MRDPNSIDRRYANFYRLYAQGFKQDIPIYLELAAKYQGDVLEIGCRTGRVARYLAAAGYSVVAADTARPMLELAAEAVRPFGDRARVMDFDMRRQPTAERYPVILVTLFSFNDLIDVEEQRLFLRHVRQSLATPGILALDLFCPLSLARPDEAQDWREIEHTSENQKIVVRDKRDMLTPLLERRIQQFRVEDGPQGEYTLHRRYVPPQQASRLLEEAGLESVRWIERYDLSTARPVEDDARPGGPFMVIGEL